MRHKVKFNPCMFQEEQILASVNFEQQTQTKTQAGRFKQSFPSRNEQHTHARAHETHRHDDAPCNSAPGNRRPRAARRAWASWEAVACTTSSDGAKPDPSCFASCAAASATASGVLLWSELPVPHANGSSPA